MVHKEDQGEGLLPANLPGEVDPGASKSAEALPARPRLAAIGLEAEFTLVVDGATVKPEALFGDPRAFIRPRLMHRQGTSYHLPTGGAVYFDTGVIEIATPVIEIDRGCAARAGRQLWEAILFLRRELDAWETRTNHDTRLVGFSTHYNVSIEHPTDPLSTLRTVENLAELLVYLLPPPVMLLATNRLSTGVGVRPRGDRIEITADFTPSAALMIATATLITGIVRAVMQWPSFNLDALDRRGLPVIEGFKPMPHTSRKGWLARSECYEHNPFAEDPDLPVWRLRPAHFERRGEAIKLLSLREIARRTIRHFRRPIRQIADPFTVRLVNDVLAGRAPSLLDLPNRPNAYENVGRLCLWDNLFPEKILRRSRYERVLIRAISGHKLKMNGRIYTPVAMHGWAEVVFRRDDDTRHAFSFDYLLQHLDAWERSA